MVYENDLRKNGNYRMVGGRFENFDYEGIFGDDVDFIDVNEIIFFDLMFLFILVFFFDGDIEMIVRYFERGGRFEILYVEIFFGGDVIIEGIERRFNVLWKLMMGFV